VVVRSHRETVPVRTRGHDPLRSVPPRVLPVALIAMASAGVVLLARGGEAFWVCLPAVLLGASASRTRLGAGLSALTVVGLTAAAATYRHPLPSLSLALLVPAASVAVLVAMRERLEHEREALRDFALTDPLTGIANRRSLLSQIDYEVARHTRAGLSFSLLMLDLDGFKGLNDRYGHAAGDDLLHDVAAAMRDAIRAQDTVARIGGDEFCVLAPETDHAGAGQLVSRVEHAVGQVTVGVKALQASSGFAVFPDDGLSAAALMKAADGRLLGAKRERRHDRADRRAA
jgi:diguanylate cyclase (GGDEF)-like protein